MKIRVLVLCLSLLPALSASVGPAPQPRLEVRLQDHVTSYSSPVGTQFRCVVIREFRVGENFIPQGSTVIGTVRKQRPVGIGIVRERASLELSFDRLETPDGEVYPFSATLASIDNAREDVTATGKIKGVLAASNPGNFVNGFWMRPSFGLVYRSMLGLTGASNQVWLKYSMGPAGAAGLFVVRCLILPFPEPEIHLTPGTDMKLTVKLPMPVIVYQPPDPATELNAWKAPTEEPQLQPVSEREMTTTRTPARVTTNVSVWMRDKLGEISYANGQTAPDLMNVVMLGSRQQITSSFSNAGWSIADQRSLTNSSRVYRAFSNMRNYSAAPVSKLLFHGSEPDLIFEKSFNTVAQRHHIRLWNGGSLDGQEVWLGAATHDTGLAFKLKSMTFTHKIDKNIDGERDKISTDLTFAGCAEPPVLLDGPASSKTTRVNTDGRVAVLTTASCEARDDFGEEPRPPGTKLTRLTRRVVLEARNYLLRDNAYYWGYRVIRSRFAPGSVTE